jgi:acyl-CoA hydrolase/GNAT superfamily N-acetyltransferase
MDVASLYQKKKISFAQLCDIIRPGSRVFLSSGPAIPLHWVTEMFRAEHHNLQDLELIHLNNLYAPLSSESSKNSKFRLKTFSAGQSASKDALSGRIDYVPAHFAGIPYTFVSGAIGLDVAIVHTSPPDKRGFLNLGIVMDIADIAIQKAPLVIAEVNPNMPVTYGKTSVHIDQIDYILESDYPLIEYQTSPPDEILSRIGWHVSNLIDNDSTVALHVGHLYDAVAHHLCRKKGLKINTHIVSDWIIELIESGALSFERDMNQSGPVTTSACFGSRKLYDYVDHNPSFEFIPMMRLSYQSNLAHFRKLVNVMNVKRTDLSAESIVFNTGDNVLSGYERKLTYAIYAGSSRGGKAIVALRSVDKGGNSNIVLTHTEDPDLVRSTLGVNQYVVTEYGVANIFGKSIRERALALIDISHPVHRKKLFEEAKAAGYLYPDQIYNLDSANDYPYHLETVKSFSNRLEIKFRPIKSSDEDMMRRLFYQFSDDQKYYRYFSRIRAMPHREMQKYVNIDHKNVVALVGVVWEGDAETIVAEARYAYEPSDDAYEMAFIVAEPYQGKGIASFLFNYLLQIAKSQGIEKIQVVFLSENMRMEKMLRHSDITPEINRDYEEVRYLFRL